MSTINKINFQTEKIYNSPYGAFKSSKEEKNKKFQAQQAKGNYISSKTALLEDIAVLTLLGSFILGAHNVSFSRKLKTKEWIALSLFATTVATHTTLSIKKHQYAKEYDKEMNK